MNTRWPVLLMMGALCLASEAAQAGDAADISFDQGSPSGIHSPFTSVRHGEFGPSSAPDIGPTRELVLEWGGNTAGGGSQCRVLGYSGCYAWRDHGDRTYWCAEVTPGGSFVGWTENRTPCSNLYGARYAWRDHGDRRHWCAEVTPGGSFVGWTENRTPCRNLYGARYAWRDHGDRTYWCAEVTPEGSLVGWTENQDPCHNLYGARYAWRDHGDRTHWCAEVTPEGSFVRWTEYRSYCRQ